MTGHRTYTRKFDHVSVRTLCLSRRIQAAPLLYQTVCKTEDQKTFRAEELVLWVVVRNFEN